MNNKIKNAIEKYQCSGCISGHNIECYELNNNGGIGCSKHYAGTMITNIGQIFLGMPKGFNRLGYDKELKPYIYEKFSDSNWEYDKYNIPVWKYLSKDNYTFVRGIMPRLNQTFIHIYLEDCIDKINCLEITEFDINQMD